MDITSVGPVETGTRDALAEFRDREELPNYNAALETLLDRCEEDA